MRDITGRLKRRRLSRYAPPEDPLVRRLHWAWLGFALWFLWVTLLSDHGFYRLWQLRRENARTRIELERTRAEAQRLHDQLADPTALRGLAERVLREKSGMARPGEIIYRIKGERDTLGRN